jgi:hypothetical protein
MMDNLHFKSNREAFDYALQYFGKSKIEQGQSYIGIVEQVDNSAHPAVYKIEIVCKSGSIFKSKTTAFVGAVSHPELKIAVNKNDLVLFGAHDTSTKVPTGFILNKLLPEFDLKNKHFKIAVETVDFDRAIAYANKAVEYEIDHKYGLLLKESEIIESEQAIYFCQTNRNQLVAGWKKDNKIFDVNIDRSLLDGLSFSTPKRFEQFVFGKSDQQLSYRNKQCLIEYLFQGIGTGDYKTLAKKIDNGSRIEFSLASKAWNEMLIGKAVGIEGVCKYFEKNATEERILNFALMCDNWNVTIEYVLGDYEDFEQQQFMLKQFDNYYSN